MKKGAKTISIILIITMIFSTCALLVGCNNVDSSDDEEGKYLPQYEWPDLSFNSNDLEAMAYNKVCNIAKTSVVGILSKTSLRKTYITGFIISSDGYILTFGQALPTYNDVTVLVTLSNNDTVLYNAKIICMSEMSTAIEPALLKIKDIPQGVEFNPIAISDIPTEQGDPSILIGNMNNQFIMAHSALVGMTSYDYSINSLLSKNVLVIDAPINKNYLGAPIINFRGEVIGMVIGLYIDNNSYLNSMVALHIGYALKAEDIKDFLDKHYNA